ncbi:hypothetical protein QP164_09745 [Sphingomonas sp. LR59]|uniref:hypothetical protein n=1 Tax=Sphingomonas sp. LR59 TaxID=3050232 RepID=UPI002FE2A98D
MTISQFGHHAFELAEHDVQPRGQTIERVATAGDHVDATREVALARRFDRLGDAVEAATDIARENEAPDHAKRERKEHGNRERAFDRTLLCGDQVEIAPCE